MNEGIKIAAIALDLRNAPWAASTADPATVRAAGDQGLRHPGGVLRRPRAHGRARLGGRARRRRLQRRATRTSTSASGTRVAGAATAATRRSWTAPPGSSATSPDAWGLSEVSPPALDALVRRISISRRALHLRVLRAGRAGRAGRPPASIWKPSSRRRPARGLAGGDRDAAAPAAATTPAIGRGGAREDFRPLSGSVPVRDGARRGRRSTLRRPAPPEGDGGRQPAAPPGLAHPRASRSRRSTTRRQLDVISAAIQRAWRAALFPRSAGGLAILGAQDEREGAFTYLQSPRTPIDNIFLSPGMKQTVGARH